jgi:hypothetical protein
MGDTMSDYADRQNAAAMRRAQQAYETPPEPDDGDDVLIKPPAQELVPVPLTKSSLIPHRDTPITQCPTNLPLSTMEGRKLMFAAGNPSDLVIDDNNKDRVGRPFLEITVHYYLGYPEEFTDPDTGEVTEGTRYCFFTKEGQTFKTSSAHAWKRVKAMLELFTPEEWQDGITLRITQRKSRNPQRQSPYHDIRLA